MGTDSEIPDRKEKMNKLRVYRTSEQASIPKFATQGSAAFDLSACFAIGEKIKTYNPWNKGVNIPAKMFTGIPSVQIYPGYRAAIPTGLIFDIDPDHVLKVYSRSSLPLKNGLVAANGVGIIDSDYVQQLFVLVYNTSDGPLTISNGDRIAQAMLEKKEVYEFEEISEPPAQKTDRTGGLGSTGL